MFALSLFLGPLEERFMHYEKLNSDKISHLVVKRSADPKGIHEKVVTLDILGKYV